MHEIAAAARLTGASLTPYVMYGFAFSEADTHAHALLAGLEQRF